MVSEIAPSINIFAQSMGYNTYTPGLTVAHGFKVEECRAAAHKCSRSTTVERLGSKVHIVNIFRHIYRFGKFNVNKFIAERSEKEAIVSVFSADVCEMEGAAIAQVAYVNNTPFAVVRAISDSADEGSSMDYMEFLPVAAKNSANLTLALIKEF